jgi:Tfp pilus assembly protein PilZ
MDFTELRRYPRVSVDFFADWGWGPECEHYDKVTSLSLSGCFLATKRDLNRGDEIYLRLSSESSGLINLRGAVRYQSRVMEGTPPTGVGVEFLGVSSDGQTKLQQVMNGYLEVT